MLKVHLSFQQSLEEMHIPLYVTKHTSRKTLPSRFIELLSEFKASEIFANIEHEVDELRRDIRVSELAQSAQIKTTFVHDRCIITPGLVKTKEGRTYTVSAFGYSLHIC